MAITPLALTANLDVGISLSVQQQEFDAADCNLVMLQVHPCLTGPFVLPENYEAVSPAYLIQTIDGKSPVAITVCLQHHVKLKSEEDCKFLSAGSTPERWKGRSVYKFKEIDENAGVFGVEDQKAKITLKEFGLLILAKRDQGMHFKGYVCPIHLCCHIIILVVQRCTVPV